MNNHPILNHVALVTRSVEKTAEKLAKFGFFIGPTEKWEGEGTLEIYVGEPARRARLLLMEPYKDGAYQRALDKRGSGLHHVAIDVSNLHAYIDGLSGSGWILHQNSAKSMLEHQTAWLWKPGVGALIEVQQRDGHEKSLLASRFVTQIAVPLEPRCESLIAALQCPEVIATKPGDGYFDIHSQRISVSALLS